MAIIDPPDASINIALTTANATMNAPVYTSTNGSYTTGTWGYTSTPTQMLCVRCAASKHKKRRTPAYFMWGGDSLCEACFDEREFWIRERP